MNKKITALLCAFLLCLFCLPSSALTRDFASVKINEIMASNGDTILDSEGTSPDWIELKNISDDDIDLSGLCLSDGKKNLEKFVFPEGIVLPKGGFLVIFCSEEESVKTLDGGAVEIHTAFKLSADGEKAVLSYQGAILDIVRFDMQTKDVSWALKDDGTPNNAFDGTTLATGTKGTFRAPNPGTYTDADGNEKPVLEPGDYTLINAEAIKAKVGDPRWLP